MFIGNMKLMTTHPDELITLEELMFRWSDDPIFKICYELHAGRFTNITISEFIRTQPDDGDKEDIVFFSTLPWDHDQASYCYAFNRLAVFKKEVYEVEQENPYYSAIDLTDSHYLWYERCTKTTYRRIAPLILYANFRLVGYRQKDHKALFRQHIRNIIESDEIFSPSNCLPAPKKDWAISEHAAKPILRHSIPQSSANIVIDHSYFDNLIAESRAQGITDDENLCRILMEHAPHITGASVVRHIFDIIPKDEKGRLSVKRRGNRLKEKTRKLFQI